MVMKMNYRFFPRILASKKAADPNQIFIYIAAIVIVGFVFLYGFKAIGTFLKSTQDIELAKFVKDFESRAKSASTDFGSIQSLAINIPERFTRVCIIDNYKEPPLARYPQNGNQNCEDPLSEQFQLTPEVCDQWDEQFMDYSANQVPTLEPVNVFFIDGENRIGHIDYIANIEIAPNNGNYLCSKDGQLILEGMARVARVSLDS